MRFKGLSDKEFTELDHADEDYRSSNEVPFEEVMAVLRKLFNSEDKERNSETT